MAWSVPRTWITGEVVTAAIMNTHVRDNELYLYGGAAGRKPSVNVYSNSLTYSQANATENAFVAATIGTITVGEDTDSAWNTTTGVYTVTTPGLWVFKITAAWASNTTGGRAHHFANTSMNYWNSINANTDPSGTGRFVSTIVDRFAANNTVSPTVYQGSGAALALNMVSFTGTWIGA